MYYYDKADLYDFNNSNKMCFVMPNGIGGFVASSLVNSIFKKEYGYLVSSYKKVILSKVKETVVMNNNVYNLEAQEYTDKIINGQKYLDEFSFNYIPSWQYNVNGIIVKKKICPIYGTNGVAITYEVFSNNDCEFYYEPVFNYRDINETIIANDLEFSELYKSNQVVLTPKKDDSLKIKFIYNSGNIYVNDDKYSNNYKLDDCSQDAGYNPFRVKVDLKAHQIKYISVICTIDKMPKYDAFGIMISYEERISKLIRQSKITDSLGKDLVVSADSFIYKNMDNISSILSTIPNSNEIPFEAFVGIMLVTKRFKEAKEMLLSISNFNSNENILWYINACYKYYEYTNDKNFISAIYNKLECFLDLIDNDFDSIKTNALWYNALMIMSKLANHLGIVDKYIETANIIKEDTIINLKNDFDVLYATSLPFKLLDGNSHQAIINQMGNDFKLSLIGCYIDAYRFINGGKDSINNDIKKIVNRVASSMNEGLINGLCDGSDSSTNAIIVGELLRTYYENYLMEK